MNHIRRTTSVTRTLGVASALAIAASMLPTPSVMAIPAFAANAGMARIVAPISTVAPIAGARIVRRDARLGIAVVEVGRRTAAEAYRVLATRYGPAHVRPDALAHVLDYTPSDPLWPQMWGPAKIGMPTVWATSLGSPATVVAILDSGVTANADLSGAIVGQTDIVNGDEDATDDHGHGTAVAAIVAGRIDNGVGGAGICPACSILAVKVADADGDAWDSDIAAGITWAVDHGASVINLSLGGTDDQGELDAAVAYARSSGVSIVAGAGNDGSSTAEYPAALPGVLAVGATAQSDALEAWSQRGDWVDLAAPGTAAVLDREDRNVTFSGTSAATPYVSGALALLASAVPTSTVATREAALTSTAAPLPTEGLIAGGRIDVAAALATLQATSPPPQTPVPGAPAITISGPAKTTLTRTSGVTVGWSEQLENGASVTSRAVTQERTEIAAGACDWSGWAIDAVLDGSANPTSAPVASGSCYRWRIEVVDSLGRTGAATSAAVLVDRARPTIRVTAPLGASRISSSRYTFRWTSKDAGSGVDGTKVTLETGLARGTSCVSWRAVKTTPDTASPYPVISIARGTCVRLRIVVTDRAGNAVAVRTAAVRRP